MGPIEKKLSRGARIFDGWLDSKGLIPLKVITAAITILGGACSAVLSLVFSLNFLVGLSKGHPFTQDSGFISLFVNRFDTYEVTGILVGNLIFTCYFICFMIFVVGKRGWEKLPEVVIERAGKIPTKYYPHDYSILSPLTAKARDTDEAEELLEAVKKFERLNQLESRHDTLGKELTQLQTQISELRQELGTEE